MVNVEKLTGLYGQVMDEIQPGWRDSEHEKDTPKRVAKWWSEFLDYDAGNCGTSFPVDNVDQMVAVSGIDVWSLCAHHLLPFSASVSVGYIAGGSVLGLSKFARIAQKHAHTPTTQEQLAAAIADEITAITGAEDVAVQVHGVHMCMAMRGIKIPATMTTSVTRGMFREDAKTRSEWFSILANRAKNE